MAALHTRAFSACLSMARESMAHKGCGARGMGARVQMASSVDSRKVIWQRGDRVSVEIGRSREQPTLFPTSARALGTRRRHRPEFFRVVQSGKNFVHATNFSLQAPSRGPAKRPA